MRVMVIGASERAHKYGNKAVRAFLRQGHEVFPVNPRLARLGVTIEGLRVYGDVTGPPGPIDRATVYLSPIQGMGILPDLAARGDVAELWLNPGAESPELVAEAKRLGLNPIQACSIIAIGEIP